jgi:hypothetical protein
MHALDAPAGAALFPIGIVIAFGQAVTRSLPQPG